MPWARLWLLKARWLAPSWCIPTVERLPVSHTPAVESQPFIRLDDVCLTAKAADPRASTIEQEAESDRLVPGRYGLKPEARDIT